MFREFIIFLYLIFINLLFNFYKLFPMQKKRTVFVVSFGDNASYVIEQLIKRTDEEIVVLEEKSSLIQTLENERFKKMKFTLRNPFQFILSFYYLATSHTIFFDNYFGFLANISFRKNVRRIQLWHAAGAFKKFGMQDESNRIRSKSALKRFQKVYNSFTHIVVGSEKMKSIFKESFNNEDVKFIHSGIPRTDFFFSQQKQIKAKEAVLQKYPFLNEKRVILYAPTYRDENKDVATLPLNYKKILEKLGDDTVILLKLHPAVTNKLKLQQSQSFYVVDDQIPVNDLLLFTNILITDYSSIPFEFSLLQRPIIFYTYDLEQYAEKRGLYEDFKTSLPGPIAKSTDEIIDLIQNKSFSTEKMKKFAYDWNTYSTGKASENVVRVLYDL